MTKITNRTQNLQKHINGILQERGGQKLTSFNRIQDIPVLKSKVGMRMGNRASSAVSSSSKHSARSLQSATSRSFKLHRKNVGTQQASQRSVSHRRSKKKSFSYTKPQGFEGSYANKDLPFHNSNKYIKNVMSIPKYLRDRGEFADTDRHQFVI